MSTSKILYHWGGKPLARNLQELVRERGGRNKPEYAWLASRLENRHDLLPRDKRTEVSVFDVNSDGRVLDPKFGSDPRLGPEWLRSPRKLDDRVRIVHIGIENEDVFNTTIIDALAMEYNLNPTFFLDHFLPSLSSDRRIMFEDQSLSWVPPDPSQHQCLRLKDCEGRNISAAFVCADITGAYKTGNYLHSILIFPSKIHLQ